MIEETGIKAVEVYINERHMNNPEITETCQQFKFDYALHAPNDVYAPEETFSLAKAIKAKLVVTHNLFWDDEWPAVIEAARKSGVPLAIENVDGMYDFEKVIRRYGAKRCIDFEHLIFQINEMSPNIFALLKNPLKDTVHVHMTGYELGSGRQHTHFNEAPEHSKAIIDFLMANGYDGMVVSEAEVKHQTREEFQKLKDFFDGVYPDTSS